MNKIKSHIIVVSFFMFILIMPHNLAENSSEIYPSEINVFILEEIPQIKIDNWTAINCQLIDRCGINWTFIKKSFGFELNIREVNTIEDRFHNLIQHLKRGKNFILWKYVLGLPQPIERFLGYTSFKLTASVIGDNVDGWQVKTEPSTILESTTGFEHNFTIYVKVDDSAVDYAVNIEINVTRIDALGGIYGYSMIYIPVKVNPESYLSVSLLDQIIMTSPKCMTNVSFNLTNEGYYRNVFYLRSKTSSNSLYSSIHQQATVIDSGETKQLTLSLITPEKVIDFGTPYIIEVYAADSLNSSSVHIGSLTVITKGFYLSFLTIILICISVLIVLLACFIFRCYFLRRQRHLFYLPDKPWKIPEEKQFLKQLRKKDKEHYRTVKSLMKQEYQSAMYSYKSFRTHQKKLKQQQRNE